MNQSASSIRGERVPRQLDIGHELKNLKIMTLNASGLRNKKKRSTVFRLLKKEKVDIIALQESYLLENEITSIEMEWGGKVSIGQGTVRSMGQVILLSKPISNKFQITELYNDSQILVIMVNDKNGKGIIIANIYAPNKEQERDFFFSKCIG